MNTNSKAHFSDLITLARLLRRKMLDMTVSAGKGHLGGAFSCTEILIALYHGGILRVDPLHGKDPSRDRFILSKGHACLALYTVLAHKGFFPLGELDRYGHDGSMLGGHPDHEIPGVEVPTGSLGHGLGIACGLAVGAKLNNKDYVTVALLGDGECNEGSVWEGAAFAGVRNLTNLIAIVDCNGAGATDFTKNFFGAAVPEEKWRSFGWEVRSINGHNFEEIFSALGDIRNRTSSRPLAIIAHTTKGKGVSFMENDYHWHHGVPTGNLLDIARTELN